MKYKGARKRRFKTAKRYKPVTLRSKFKKERSAMVYQYARFFAVLAVAGVIGWFGYKAIRAFAFKSGYFEIKEIRVNGIENIAESEIIALLPFRVGDNMLKVWLSPVEKNLRKSKPELKNINISRGWKKVKIEFEEREPIAVVKVKDRLCGVDKDNIPFPLRGKWILDSSEKLPRINVDDTAFRQDVLDFIGTVKLKAEKLYDNISCVYTEPSDTVVFVQRNETKILWGTPNKSGFNDKLGKLYMIQADAAKRFSGLEYINLCYFDDGRIIVKPRIITTNTR